MSVESHSQIAAWQPGPPRPRASGSEPGIGPMPWREPRQESQSKTNNSTGLRTRGSQLGQPRAGLGREPWQRTHNNNHSDRRGSGAGGRNQRRRDTICQQLGHNSQSNPGDITRTSCSEHWTVQLIIHAMFVCAHTLHLRLSSQKALGDPVAGWHGVTTPSTIK